jgi:hypothetical protein
MNFYAWTKTPAADTDAIEIGWNFLFEVFQDERDAYQNASIK